MTKTHSKEFVKNKKQSHVILKCPNLAKHCRQEHILHMHILKGNQTFWLHQNPKVEIKEIWVGNNSECTNKGQIKLKETKKKKKSKAILKYTAMQARRKEAIAYSNQRNQPRHDPNQVYLSFEIEFILKTRMRTHDHVSNGIWLDSNTGKQVHYIHIHIQNEG